MADIEIQRKTTPVWPWILGIIIVVAIILFLVAGRDREALQNQNINTGGGPNESSQPIPGDTRNPPSPANPDAPNRPAGRNPQVPPAAPAQPAAPPAPSESTIESAPAPGETDTNKSNDGASIEPVPNDQILTDQIPELAQQNDDVDDINQSDDLDVQNTDADDPNAENSVIIFEDDEEFIDENPDNAQFNDAPPEVVVFSQYLLQNSDTQADSTTVFTSNGLRNLNDAVFVLSDQDDDVLNEQRDGNRAQLDEYANQIDGASSQGEQARITADAFSLAADWIDEVSQVLYPNSEPQAQAALQAADEFDPETALNEQLPAVRAFFQRADSALQEMANAPNTMTIQ